MPITMRPSRAARAIARRARAREAREIRDGRLAAGRTTTSASRPSPGGCEAHRDAGSAASGSRSSKLAIRGSRGTATTTRARRRHPQRFETERILFGAGAPRRVGHDAEDRPPVRAPSSSRRESERSITAKRLTMSPATRARSSAAAARAVPTSAAEHPPRRCRRQQHGRVGQRGDPHVGEVDPEVDLRRAAAPSMTTRS